MSAYRGRVIIGVIGDDIHIVGNRIMQLALEESGFQVFNLRARNRPEEFCQAALEVNADAVFVSSSEWRRASTGAPTFEACFVNMAWGMFCCMWEETSSSGNVPSRKSQNFSSSSDLIVSTIRNPISASLSQTFRRI